MKHTVAIYMVHRNGVHEPAPDLEIETRSFEDEQRARDYCGVLNSITCYVLTRYRGGQQYVAVVSRGEPKPFYEEKCDERRDAILSELEAGIRASVDELFAHEKRDDGRAGFGARIKRHFARRGE